MPVNERRPDLPVRQAAFSCAGYRAKREHDTLKQEGPAVPALPDKFQPERGLTVPGVRLAVGRARFKYRDRDDLLLVGLPAGTRTAGVLTKSACASPEVDWCRSLLAEGAEGRGLVVCAGNSNAFTGMVGEEARAALVEAAAAALGTVPGTVYAAATGVIGEPLPAEKGTAILPALADGLAEPTDWLPAARTIGTTDTFPKVASARAVIGGETVTITGIAKGSGMIAPDMATMLAFVFTDASIAQPLLQQMLREANTASFSSITVDSDTSTSDTCLLFATGQSAAPELNARTDPGADAFFAALQAVMTSLAHQIVRDGEGAKKFITVAVTGAADDDSARRVALAVANSPLVKTAIAGEDANWGRVVMAVGKAGEPADRDRLSIRFGGIEVAANGARVPDYDEAPVARHLQGTDILLEVDLGLAAGSATVWTCDLTHGYISINADYRS